MRNIPGAVNKFIPEAWKLGVHLAVALGKGGVGKLVPVELHGRGQLQQLVLQSKNKENIAFFFILTE